MGRRGKGRATRRNKQQNSAESEEIVNAPHTFVVKRGSVGKRLSGLMIDIRKLLNPFTALNLQCGKNNILKDYLTIAGPLHVSHIISLTRSEAGQSFLRLIRLPSGPTLTFRIDNFELMREVVSVLRKQVAHPKQYESAPLLILNNFSVPPDADTSQSRVPSIGDIKKRAMHFTMLRSMFQGMLPSIDVKKVKLNTIKRCFLLNYQHETGTIDWRHYNIKLVPSGVSRAVKKLVLGRVPQLGARTDISEFVLDQGGLSETEGEDGVFGGDAAATASQVVVSQSTSARGVHEHETCSVRLTELGPRLTLRLIKIEENICTGEVLYHEHKSHTTDEIEEQRERVAERRRLKAIRRTEQESNVERKEHEKAEHRVRTIEGMQRKYGVKRKIEKTTDQNDDNDDADNELEEDDDKSANKEVTAEASNQSSEQKMAKLVAGRERHHRRRQQAAQQQQAVSQQRDDKPDSTKKKKLDIRRRSTKKVEQ